jgi:hypothetical protein
MNKVWRENLLVYRLTISFLKGEFMGLQELYKYSEDWIVSVKNESFSGTIAKDERESKIRTPSKRETVRVYLPSNIICACQELSGEEKRATAVRITLEKILESGVAKLFQERRTLEENIKREIIRGKNKKSFESFRISLKMEDVDKCHIVFSKVSREDSVEKVVIGVVENYIYNKENGK